MGNSVFTGPTHAHASSIYLSPAALWLAGRGQHFFLGGTLLVDHLGIDRLAVDEQSGALSDAGSVSATTLSPGALIGVYTSVGDRFHFGASLNTPYHARFISEEPALRYHTRGGQLLQVIASLAGSYAVTNRFVMGLGLSLGYTRFDLSLDRDTALEAGSDDIRGIASDCGGSPCGFENPEAGQRMDFETATPLFGGLFARENLGLSVGIAVQPVDDWWTTLGAVVPAGSFFDLDLPGDAEVIAPPRDGGDSHRGKAEITFRMPQMVLIGVRGPIFTGWDIVASGRWQNYSNHEQLDLRTFGGDLDPDEVPEWYPRDRDFADVWRLDAGLERQEDAVFRYGGRARFETAAIDATKATPLQIEGLNATLGGGAELRIAQYIVMTLTYDLSWYPRMDATDSAFDPRDRLACVDSNFDFDSCEAARQGRATPTAAGTYDRLRQSIGLSIRYDNL